MSLFLILFDLSFYFHSHFTVFFLSFFFMHAYTDDLDSVTYVLRDSVKVSNDGYDVAFSLTHLGACTDRRCASAADCQRDRRGGESARMQQRTVDAPTPQVLEETVEVGRSVSHERVQQRAAEQIEDAPQSPAEVVEAVRTVPRQLEVVAGGVSERHQLVTLGVCFRMFLELDPTLSSEKTSEPLSCLRRCLPPLDIQNKKFRRDS